MKAKFVPTSIVPMTRRQFFGGDNHSLEIVHVTHYGTKLIGAFKLASDAVKAIAREVKIAATGYP